MMRGIMLLLACALAVQAGHPPGGFVVNGTVDVPHRGRALLLADTDTVAVAAIADDGTFTMEGAATEVRLARIVAEGVWGSVELFLENGAVFDVTLGTVPKVEGGGREQRLAARFQEIGHRAAHRKNASGEGYFGALQRGDTATVRRIEGIFAEISLDAAREETELIRANPASFVSAWRVHLSDDDDLNVLKQRYGALDPSLRRLAIVQRVGDRIADRERMEPGCKAPDFTLATPDGGTVSLHGIEARVKLVDFWASWCAPCRKENPHLVAAYRELHGKGLEILSVSLDTDHGKWTRAIAEDSLGWLHGCDFKGWHSPLVGTYLVGSVPFTVIVDENDTIVAMGLRGDELLAALRRLLE